MSEVAILADTQMQEIESSLPGARRALFQRYHVGGCSSCGFQPTDTLKQVCENHNLLDVVDRCRLVVRDLVVGPDESGEGLYEEFRDIHVHVDIGVGGVRVVVAGRREDLAGFADRSQEPYII